MSSVPMIDVTRDHLTRLVAVIAISWSMMREEVSVEPKNDSLCCVFCQSEDPDEYGQPVRNEVCACRGDAGCFHLSCLAKFAKTKTREARRVCLDTFW